MRMFVSLICWFISVLGGRSNSQTSRSYTYNLECIKATRINTGKVRHEFTVPTSVSHFMPFLSHHVLLVVSEMFLLSRRPAGGQKRFQLGPKVCGAFITASIIYSAYQPSRPGTDLESGSVQQLGLAPVRLTGREAALGSDRPSSTLTAAETAASHLTAPFN